MPDIDQILFRAVNGLAGRSWLFDSLVTLGVANELIKSAPVAACFCAAWYRDKTLSETLTTRRTLLITLLAACFTLVTTTAISSMVLSPRPYLRSHKIYSLREGQLHPLPRKELRVPLDKRSRERELALKAGDVPPGDLRSFPSDHAGFFFCIALGTYLASRRIGCIAVAWTLVVILMGKVIPGMHTPFEVGAGCMIAAAWLIPLWYVDRNWLERIGTRVATWTTQYQPLSAALLFMVLFEVASTLDHFKALLSAVARRL